MAIDDGGMGKAGSPKGPGLDWCSGLPNVGGLETLRPPGYLELDLIALGQALEALGLNGAEMHEHVVATLLSDETVALRIVEPLDCTLCHRQLPRYSEALASVMPRHNGGGPSGSGGRAETPRD